MNQALNTRIPIGWWGSTALNTRYFWGRPREPDRRDRPKHQGASAAHRPANCIVKAEWVRGMHTGSQEASAQLRKSMIVLFGTRMTRFQTFWPWPGRLGWSSAQPPRMVEAPAWPESGKPAPRQCQDSTRLNRKCIKPSAVLALSRYRLGAGQAMACQTEDRRVRLQEQNRAGHALIGQYLGASLDLASPSKSLAPHGLPAMLPVVLWIAE